MGSPTAAATGVNAVDLLDALFETRERTLALVAHLSEQDLQRVHSPLMSPLVWDLGHIAAFEDLWLVHRYGGGALLRDDLAGVYDAFESPRAGRGQLPFLDPTATREYLAQVRSRTLDVIDERGVGDGWQHELVLRHEQQHGETMLQTLQLARLPGCEPAPSGRSPSAPAPSPPAPAPTGLELIEVAAGECTIGACEAPTPAQPVWAAFAYDNERPRHRTDVRGYLIGRTPITNASYLTFVEGGGYERRAWWSDEGWAWKEQYDITRPGGWTAELDAEWRLGKLEALHPHRPVVHVSWFEADAFARANDARLPTEVEWEKAATWEQERETGRRYPWGSEQPIAGIHANVDHHCLGPAPAGAYTAGASPYGCLGMIGDVWEWTCSDFTGYPGFVAHPYREYSEVFFGADHKVLRGGSWATRARAITPTFRNWDHSQRRQIFAGMRIARDLQR